MTTTPDAHYRQSDIKRFWELYERQHLWPEERADLQFLARKLGVRLQWFNLKLGDLTAKPVQKRFEELT